MPTIAGTQQSVTDPRTGLPGQQYGLSKFWLAAQGFLAAVDITVGRFVWGINGTKQVTNVKGINTQLVGIVERSESTPIPYGDTTLGYSYVVPAGYQCQVLSQASIRVVIEFSGNSGGAINVGDLVYARDSDGAAAVGVDGVTGYSPTNFQVIVNELSSGDVENMVVISNTEQFLGAV